MTTRGQAFGLLSLAFVGACAPARMPSPAERCRDRPLLEPYRSGDALVFTIQIENALSSFEPTELCVVVDGHSLKQDAPRGFVKALADHRSLDLRIAVDPKRQHSIAIHGTFGAASGSTFEVQSSHILPASPGTVTVRCEERGETTALRPMLTWTDRPKP